MFLLIHVTFDIFFFTYDIYDFTYGLELNAAPGTGVFWTLICIHLLQIISF
ncbi:hypothetical protein [Anditalea andensis]|uniref:hypothetical protein n=1 Tax=Anditalea andensis TaxID=1048983 RepID=UPI001969E7DD|nr:hypothetical protein [Anditalea andensis]